MTTQTKRKFIVTVVGGVADVRGSTDAFNKLKAEPPKSPPHIHQFIETASSFELIIAPIRVNTRDLIDFAFSWKNEDQEALDALPPSSADVVKKIHEAVNEGKLVLVRTHGKEAKDKHQGEKGYYSYDAIGLSTAA